MELIIPSSVATAFLHRARANVDRTGELVETMCYYIGFIDGCKGIVTEVVIPNQIGDAGKVEDTGIYGQDTLQWALRASRSAVNYPNVRLLAWCHTHVRGAVCGFSSVDVHCQFAIECVFGAVLGIVYEIGHDREVKNAGAFTLTPRGKSFVQACSQSGQDSFVQHESCADATYFAPFVPEPTYSREGTFFVTDEMTVFQSLGNSNNAFRLLQDPAAAEKARDSHVGTDKEDPSPSSHDCHSNRQVNDKPHMSGQSMSSPPSPNNSNDIVSHDKVVDMNRNLDIFSSGAVFVCPECQKNFETTRKLTYHFKRSLECGRRYGDQFVMFKATLHKERKKANRGNKSIKNSAEKLKARELLIEESADTTVGTAKKANDDLFGPEFKCPKCDEHLGSQRKLTYHFKNFSSCAEEYGAAFDDFKAKRKPAAVEAERKKTLLKCPICQISFGKKWSFLHHAVAPDQCRDNYTLNALDDWCNEYDGSSLPPSYLQDVVLDLNKKRRTNFFHAISHGPSYPCFCCERRLFKSSVTEVDNPESYLASLPPSLSKLLPVDPRCRMFGAYYICRTCNLSLKVKKVLPGIAHCNGLQLDEIPEELQVTELERQLFARNILFMMLSLMPKTRMPKIRDRIVNVPILDVDILNTVSVLPRPVEEAGMVNVRLKRKLAMKNTHLEQLVRPNIIIQALETLKSNGNPFYQNIVIDYGHEDVRDPVEPDTGEQSDESITDYGVSNDGPNWDPMEWDGPIPTFDPEAMLSSDENDSVCSENSGDDLEDELDAVRRYQVPLDEITCMVPNDVEAQFMFNKTDQPLVKKVGKSIIEIAPGEGKRPTSWLGEKDFDCKSFPNLHPTGRFGVDFERDAKLTHQQYFISRLLNIDSRFRDDYTYVFAAQQRVEQEKLEGQFNISFQRGKYTMDGNKVKIGNTIDYFSSFRAIPGSPKYWQDMKKEMFARLHQLGPFQYFFTLSCAEMRWPEVIASVLAEKGHSVHIPRGWTGSEDTVLVDDLPLPIFLRESRISMSALMKKDTLLVTRMFDARVRAFIYKILMARDAPLPVVNYNYRVEFQARGMPHIHGVLWLDAKTVDGFLKDGERDYNEDAVISHIDQFVTCALPPAGDPLRSIVETVQVHNHTKTCKKTDNACRFNYPKLPSNKTIVAHPLHARFTAEEKDEILRQAKYILGTVINYLEHNDIPEDLSLESLLQYLGIPLEDYENALAISERGRVIVYKRRPCEKNINTYNEEFLLAWNANTDFQFVIDNYSVVSYITDYFTKEETQMSKLLQQTLAEMDEKEDWAKLQALKRTYLTHREVGYCEAIYRLFPTLRLKSSNIKCVYVMTGFPQNRCKAFRKLKEDCVQDLPDLGDVESDEEDDNSKGEPAPVQDNIGMDGPVLTIDGRKGTYANLPSVHEKYSCRPVALEELCLAQFCMAYSQVVSNTKVDMKDGASIDLGNIKCVRNDRQMPAFITISQPKQVPIRLRLRQRHCVLRYHPSALKASGHECYYTDLLLFFPWRSEQTDIFCDDEDQCIALYERVQDEINQCKTRLFPFDDRILDSLNKDDLRTKDIVEGLLSSVRPMGDDEDNEEEVSIDGVAYPPDEVLEANRERLDLEAEMLEETRKTNGKPSSEPGNNGGDARPCNYKEIEIDNEEEIAALIRRLVPEQRQAFDKVVRYCFESLSCRLRNSGPPEPLRLIITGGAGVGKSALIKAMAKAAEKILRQPGQHKNHPRVLVTAPTGMAASIIDGVTLHSALSLNFGDKLNPLSAFKLDTARELLKDLKLLIMDEMSMVRSDMLYQVEERLSSIFALSGVDFGGVSIVLVGDLLQLPPVRGKFIFQPPNRQSYNIANSISPLWDSFQVVLLQQNHRQGDEREWANILNNIRIGLVTKNDKRAILSRVITERTASEMSDAVHVFYLNRDVDNWNDSHLQAMTDRIVVSTAHVAVPRGHKYTVDNNRIDGTGLLKVLSMKKGARIMIIHNINVIDYLTNGTLGTIRKILVDDGKEAHCVLIEFDNPKVGLEQRRKFSNYCDPSHEGWTPIFKGITKYGLPKKRTGEPLMVTGQITQFPFRLAWAVTAHKIQGQTFKAGQSVVIHWTRSLKQGMAYVMLGRVQRMQDIYLTGNVDLRGVKADRGALNETEKLKEKASFLNPIDMLRLGQKCPRSRYIVLQNIRSLGKHWPDILVDGVLLNCDIMAFTETWLQGPPDMALPDYKGYHAIGGRGKGASVYSSMPCRCIVEDIPGCQMIEVTCEIGIIWLIYVPPGNSPWQLLAEKLTTTVYPPQIVMGDFNVTPQSKVPFIGALKSAKYIQLVTSATQVMGNLLDHIWVQEEDVDLCKLFIHVPYYSDHAGLVLQKTLL